MSTNTDNGIISDLIKDGYYTVGTVILAHGDTGTAYQLHADGDYHSTTGRVLSIHAMAAMPGLVLLKPAVTVEVAMTDLKFALNRLNVGELAQRLTGALIGRETHITLQLGVVHARGRDHSGVELRVADGPMVTGHVLA